MINFKCETCKKGGNSKLMKQKIFDLIYERVKYKENIILK